MVNPAACPETDYSCWANLEICEVEVNGEHCNGTQIKKKKKKIFYDLELLFLAPYIS